MPKFDHDLILPDGTLHRVTVEEARTMVAADSSVAVHCTFSVPDPKNGYQLKPCPNHGVARLFSTVDPRLTPEGAAKPLCRLCAGLVQKANIRVYNLAAHVGFWLEEYDRAVAKEAEQAARRESIQKRIEAEQKALEQFTATLILPKESESEEQPEERRFPVMREAFKDAQNGDRNRGKRDRERPERRSWRNKRRQRQDAPEAIEADET